jgi:hypothetical protein
MQSLFVTEASVTAAWVVPSADFNRLTYRGAGPRGKGIELEFMASPTWLFAELLGVSGLGRRPSLH